MFETVIKIDGMMCGMCEAHINDAVRHAFSVKKVSSSHTHGKTVILSEEKPNGELLKKVIADTGYEVVSIDTHPYVSPWQKLFHKA